MAKFESLGNKAEEKLRNNKIDSYLVGLWKEYKFLGEPPRLGSIAEKRLKSACDAYTSFLLGDYIVPESDKRRRELHDEIARMTTGKSYNELDYRTIEQLQDFVCLYSRGAKLSEVAEYRQN